MFKKNRRILLYFWDYLLTKFALYLCAYFSFLSALFVTFFLSYFFSGKSTLDFHSKNRLVVNGDPFSPFHYFPLFCAFSQSKMFCKKNQIINISYFLR